MKERLESMLVWPADDLSSYGPVEQRPIGKMQHIVGRVMHRNWLSIPHVTHHDDIDITLFEERRRAWNRENPEHKRSLLQALIKASVAALQEYPKFNCALSEDGTTITQRGYSHIGIAVDVPDGLLVPVIRDCNVKGLDEIGSEVARISEKARTRGLSMDEMSGGCFTLSSLGYIGGTGFTPIIQAPEVAILGICRVREVFLPDSDGQPGLSQLLPLSLSYDHRIINGADAARFLLSIGQSLETFEFEMNQQSHRGRAHE